jgi:hypothetical protein
MASIAEYLLYIAQRPDASRTHYASEDLARQQMTEHGLTTAQQNIVLNADPSEINEAIALEIGAQKGLSLTYFDPIVHTGPGKGKGAAPDEGNGP